MSLETDRFDEALYQIVTAALNAAPDNPTDAIDLMLRAAVYFAFVKLKLSRKDACDLVDVRLAEIFERFAAGGKEAKQ